MILPAQPRKTYNSRNEEMACLPQFIIVGAMKAGTNSLCHILNNHPQIFIPDQEIFFFDIDDIEQHPDFLVYSSDSWSYPNYEKNFDRYVSWYLSFFKRAKESQVIGECSTSYLASRKAARRIAELLPNVKLIFILRDPTLRAYSHYWHHLRTGRAIYDFEHTLQYMPMTIIGRSLYKAQIERYKTYFPHESLKFIIFEEFIQSMEELIKDICRFIGISPEIDLHSIDTHKNPTLIPRNLLLQILRNKILRGQSLWIYEDHLPDRRSKRPRASSAFFKKIDNFFDKINPILGKGMPPMKPQTRKLLNELFARENQGLSELVGKNVESYWYRD